MNKELQKAIMKRSRLKDKFNRCKTNENWEEFRKQRNLCTKIKRKAKIAHFENLCKNPSAKEFWKTVKPFITDKGHCTSDDYMLEENEDLIKDVKKISNLVNDFVVNIIERSTGKKPTTSSKDKSLEEIISTYKDHPSIRSIKEQFKGTGFSVPTANEENIYKILVSLNPKKAAMFLNIGSHCSLTRASVVGPICLLSRITSTNKNTINADAIKLNMIVVITTWLPLYACK